MNRMAPLSRPETLSEPQEMMNCETPTEAAKPNAISPSFHKRRVIFPSLHSKDSENDSNAQEETAKHSSTAQSPLTREDCELLASSFQFRSPVLPADHRTSRRCDELGLDMPSMSLDDAHKSSRRLSLSAQKKTAKTLSSSSAKVPNKRHEKEAQLRNALSESFPLQSPGLPPRKCAELGIDIPSMSLNDTSQSPKHLLPPKSSKAVNSKHFVPKTTTRGTSSGKKPSPQRRSRIDSSYKTFVTSQSSSLSHDNSKTPSRQSSTSSTTAATPPSPARPPSILRHGRWSISSSTDETTPPDDKESTVPSLVPIGDSNSSCETLHSEVSSTSDHSEVAATSTRKRPRSVSFDPRVWVLEYERSPEEIEHTWFSPEELEHFRKLTIARLVAHNTELLPSGTGFVVQRGSIPTKAVFALPSMNSFAEEEDDDVDEMDVLNAVNEEIQNVLVVDPHDLCAKLFTRDLQNMIPQVNVCTASSSEEARKRIAEKRRFDIIIVEERLKLFHRHHLTDQWKTRDTTSDHVSGSEFIRELAQEKKELPPEENCLFIAVSAHLDEDKERMQANGADFIWAKPPPKLDEIVRDVLLKALLVKRQKKALADHLFGDVMGAP